MQLHREVLESVLRRPDPREVRDSPIVTAVILRDGRNAADLVPYLDQVDSNFALNARRILCRFDGAAVPYLVAAMRNVGVEARNQGIEILWFILLGERSSTVRGILHQIARDMEVLLDDKRSLPDHHPDYIEHDFRGRICDLAFLALQEAVDRDYDQSLFRSLDDDARDEEIERLKRRGLGFGSPII